jgi:hypothetical protein
MLLPEVWFSVKSAVRVRARRCPHGREQFRHTCGFDNRFPRIESCLAGAVLRGHVLYSISHSPVFVLAFASGKIDLRILYWNLPPYRSCFAIVLLDSFMGFYLIRRGGQFGLRDGDHDVGTWCTPAAAPLPCRTRSYGLDCGYEYAVLDIRQRSNCFPAFRSGPKLSDGDRNQAIERHRRSLFGDSDDGTHPDTRRRHSYHAARPEDGNLPRFGRANAN